MSSVRHASFLPCRGGPGRRLRRILLCALAAASASAWADGDIRQATELLSEASLEDLLDTQITTAARRAERIADSAASVTVITADDIARATSSHIEDLFRTVPGMQVGRVNNSHYAISTRGANSVFSANLLVMVDGRTIYSPVFSGVWWDTQEIPLEEIARIEIIRGPGASLWGVNAVNGVINILTKDAANTKGGLISAGTGSNDRGNVYARYGMQFGENGYARVYARRTSMNDTDLPTGVSGKDENMAERIGFRVDKTFGDERKLTVTGESYRLESSGGAIPVPEPVPMTYSNAVTGYPQQGSHMMMRYSQPAAGGQLTLQGYFIREVLSGTSIGLGYRRNTYDFDFQHSIDLDNHRLVWGGGARNNKLDMTGSYLVSFTTSKIDERLTSLFFQDEIALMSNRLRLTLGSKFEHSDDRGLQVQPTVRALYALSEHESIWGAVSRAVRTPYWGQEYVQIHQEWRAAGCVPQIPTLPCSIVVQGDPQSQPEKINTFEVGYRTRPTDKTALDVSAFASRGRQFQSLDINPAQIAVTPTYITLPLQFGSASAATTKGVEGTLEWQVKQGFRMRFGSSWFWESYENFPTALPAALQNPAYEREFAEVKHSYYDRVTPRWSSFVRGSHDWNNLTLDWTVRHFGSLPRYYSAYTVADLRLGWQATKDLELSLAFANLGTGKRSEFGVQWFVAPTQVEPEWSLKAKWYF